MKYLTRHVRSQLGAAGPQAWQDLGRELMPDADAQLGVIATNAHGNVTTCCDLLFKSWLQRQPEASWGQLIQGLKDVGLDALAAQIEKKLEPSIHTTTTTTTVSQMPKGIAHIASDMPVLYVTELRKGVLYTHPILRI